MRVTHNEGWMATVILGQNYNFSYENAPQLSNISYRYSCRLKLFIKGLYHGDLARVSSKVSSKVSY